MHGKVFIFATIVLAAVMFLQPFCVSAQPKSIGTVPSYFSYGVVYDHWDAKRPNTFHSVVVKSDTKGLLQDKVYFPGLSVEYSYNFCRIKTLDQGGDLRFYLGPGIVAGWLSDYKSPFGLTLGIKMDLGIEFASAYTPVSVGARLAPTMGIHTQRNNGAVEMRAYKYGIAKAFMPEITMKYEFGRQTTPADADSGLSADGNSGFVADSGLSADGNSRADKRRARSYPLFTFGISHNYSPGVLFFTHYNYVDEDIVRHFKKEYRFGYRSRGSIMAMAGVNCGRYINISLGSGYSGVSSGQGIIPLILRLSGYFGNNPLRNRPFVYIDGGTGFCLHNEMSRPAILAATGGGYRFSLDKHTKLDLSAGLFVAYDHPVIPESINTSISNELALGLRFSSAIVF